MSRSLFDDLDDVEVSPLEPVDLPAHGRHIPKAEAFHERNPGVLADLIALALVFRRRGQHTNIAYLYETLRIKGSATHGDKYKLNNNYQAFYARLVMASEPELDGFFMTRRSPTDPEYHTREERP